MSVRTNNPSSNTRPVRLFAVFALAFLVQAAAIFVFHSDRRPSKIATLESARPAQVRAPIPVFTVSTGLNDGEGSLRQAITAANNSPGLSIIRFAPSGAVTVTLTSPLEVTQPLAIEGPPLTLTGTMPTIDASAVGGNLFIFGAAPGSSVKRLKVVNANGGYAFYLSKDSFGSGFYTVTIGQSKGGIFLDGTSNITVTQSLLQNMDEAGVKAAGGSRHRIGLNRIQGYSGAGILLTDGLTSTSVYTNTISGGNSLTSVPIHLMGSPPPTGISMRGNTFSSLGAPIIMGSGANNDFPAPTLGDLSVLTSTLTLNFESGADPAQFVYPLTIDFYRVSGELHAPVASRLISDADQPYTTTLNLELFYPNFDFSTPTYVAAIATTANPSTSPFSNLLLIQQPGLPVELTDFTSQVIDDAILLSWSTSSETDNAGFELQQAGPAGEFEQVAFIAGNGTTDETQSYQYRIRNPEPGLHHFRLKQIDFDGTFEYSATIEAVVVVPDEIFLAPVYPNPFNPTALVSFATPTEQRVRVDVFDVAGRLVSTLFDDLTPANTMVRVRFDASELQSGVYLIHAQGASGVRTQKVTVLK